MYYVVGRQKFSQPFYISAVEFCYKAVFSYKRHYFVFVLNHIQDFGVCGVFGALFGIRYFKVGKKHLSKLTGRIYVEFFTGYTADYIVKFRRLLYILFPDGIEKMHVDFHPALLHIEKDVDKRQFRLFIQLFHTEPLYFGIKIFRGET